MAEGEEQDNAQKTEEPTPKKLQEARKKGQVPLSREVNNWLMLFAGTMVITAMAGTVFGDMSEILTAYIEKSYAFPVGAGGVKIALGEGFKHVMAILALPFLFLLIVAFLSPFLQIGPLWAPESIQPSLSKISPASGVKRLFSMRSLMEFAKGILKITVVSLVGIVIMKPYFGQFEHLIGLPIPYLMDELHALIFKMMVGILITLLIIALIDLVYQRHEHHQKMRMTKQEVKDEHKQSEGDPHVKARLRQLRSERARQRMMQNVPSADVVITNPTHFSIALKYDPETMEAPLCVAKGIDEVALRIREVAKEHDIILFENRPLARALYDTVEIDESIPTEHYKAVAEVISYVFKMRGGVGAR
ncbi:MAG: flagellar biosynthesis protein FlhB [Alphaproteobacteria bacterium]|nr:flagellar biosynthesis protein FlhB [Alphaproteobacteria bacterium]HCQ71585.1 flagellar biosynthesis protein FlhB [Rhodospirillaceae bacterium]|tara:strand:+ start:9620 stop:10702 length:1083 start_codon:yes stop_codon:yes gene_type:complete